MAPGSPPDIAAKLAETLRRIDTARPDSEVSPPALVAVSKRQPDERIDAALAGGVEYKGTFNATTGLPSLANAEQGDLYRIATGGTIYGQTWALNDNLLINADMGGSITNSKIDKIDNTEPGALLAANNLSDLASASTARTNLGVAIGSDVQAYDQQLADVAGLTPADGAFIVGDGANFTASQERPRALR